jgi:glycosyltransferase involved in cell wall biosynthesis
VLHVIETISPREGGPPRVVSGLAAAQRALGIDAQILCGDGSRLPEYAEYWQRHVHGFPVPYLHTITAGGANLFAPRAESQSWLRENLPTFDLVHVHQLWRPVTTLAAVAARRLRVPYLLTPHNTLTRFALGQKKAKKTLARWLLWDRIFAAAAGFHALNELEATEIRQCLESECRLFVVPNGVSLDEFTEPLESAVSVPASLSPPRGPRPFILSLGRLHASKGADLLLEAFANLSGDYPTVQLACAGPDFGILSSLRRRAAELGLSARTHFLGEVSGSERLWLLRNAVCLAQPSKNEGNSLSILEAMACARPVVISDHCKFPEVAREKAGLITSLSTSDLTTALDVYLRDPTRSDADGRCARALVERSYTWDIIARSVERIYAELAASWAGQTATLAIARQPGED